MASYVDLKTQLFTDSDLNDRMNVAVIVAAITIANELPTTPNHSNRLKWAKSAFSNPASAATAMLKYLLAANKDLTIAQVQAVTDSQMQAAVDAAVDVFADGAV